MTKKELKAKKKIDKHNLKPYTTYKHWGKHFITDKNGNVEKFFEDEASAKEYQGEVLLKQQEAKLEAEAIKKIEVKKREKTKKAESDVEELSKNDRMRIRRYQKAEDNYLNAKAAVEKIISDIDFNPKSEKWKIRINEAMEKNNISREQAIQNLLSEEMSKKGVATKYKIAQNKVEQAETKFIDEVKILKNLNPEGTWLQDALKVIDPAEFESYTKRINEARATYEQEKAKHRAEYEQKQPETVIDKAVPDAGIGGTTLPQEEGVYGTPPPALGTIPAHLQPEPPQKEPYPGYDKKLVLEKHKYSGDLTKKDIIKLLTESE